jgi:hypothetical protein
LSTSTRSARCRGAPPAARRPWCRGVRFTLGAAAWDGRAGRCRLSVVHGWGAQAAVDLARRHDRRRFAADGHPLERSDRSSPDCAALVHLSQLARTTNLYMRARTRWPTVRGVTLSGVGRRGWRLG